MLRTYGSFEKLETENQKTHKKLPEAQRGQTWKIASSACAIVPISGLGPDRDQCPNMVPKRPDLPLKSRSCLIGHNRTVYRSQTVKNPQWNIKKNPGASN